MDTEKTRYRRDLWLPTLVGLVGVLASLAGWGLLVAERRARILDATRQTASETREAVEWSLERQVASLRGLSELWSEFGLRPREEWTANVGRWVDRSQGLDSIVWIDLDDAHHRFAAGRDRSAEEIASDVEEARLHLDAPHLSGPERDASGAIAYRIFLPARTPEGHAGVLVARARVDPFLRFAFRARARGHALRVFWGEEEIYSLRTPSSDPWQDWWRVEDEIALPFEGRWRIEHRPTPAFAASRLTPVPHYLLAAGILLSVVSAIAAHQLRVIVRQSRFLSASNRALEERGLELEAKVAERTDALEDAVAELEAFNTSVSHDLRSPLGAILNFTAILEEDYSERRLDEEGMVILAGIRRCAARATALLEGLLQLSRAGRAALSPQRVDMTELARETFAQVRAAEVDAQVEFLVDRLADATGDRSLLGDVFANLFSNALKYSRSREKRRITVTGRSDGTQVIYEVADNGQGFDMRFVDKLFGLFERLDPGDGVEGTGVGLAKVARIVKRHGGRVWAEGRQGEGARLSFSLPRREAG